MKLYHNLFSFLFIEFGLRSELKNLFIISAQKLECLNLWLSPFRLLISWRPGLYKMSSYEGEPIYSRRGSVLHETICFSYDDEHTSHGIFFKEDRPLKFILPVFMVQIIMAFILSRLVYFVLRPLRQPRFVCNVLVSLPSDSNPNMNTFACMFFF